MGLASVCAVAGELGCVHQPATYERADLVRRINGEGLEAAKGAATVDAGVVKTSGAQQESRAEPSREPLPDAKPAGSRPEEAAVGEKPREGEAEAEALAEELSLERARELAMRYSPVLRAARAAVDASMGDLEVVDAAFKPAFQGNYGYQAFSSDVGFVGTRGRFPVLPVRGFGPGAQDFHVSEVQMKWTIFQFGRLLSKDRQARFKTEVARLEADRACQTVAYQVARTYFQVLEAESARKIADRAVERAEAYRREAGDLLQRGSITREQALRVEADLASVRQAQSDARSEEEVAVAALNQTMGINVNAPTRVAERRDAPRLDLELKGALEISVANRREIPVVLRGIAIAREGVDFARAEFLPSVSVQAGYSNVTGTGVQNANVGAGGIFLTQDLYAGGKRRGQLRSAEAGLRGAEAQAQQVCDLIAFEVNEAFRSFEDARSRIDAARAVYLQAVENHRLVGSRYQAGDATPAEVVEARASETKSEQTFNSAFYQYQRALARLEYAVGGPLPISAEQLPAAAPVEAGPDRTPGPPSGESPFRARPGGSLPNLPNAPSFALPSTEPAPSIPSPTIPPRSGQPSGEPGLFGPPSSLSRPPYESNSPYGAKP
ncbi:TolC family protein [Paludisphaera rhizosphaerae]|uniref:TolC family protein n=1 Tax=Paludisphaera rhizosphaerae TaxID=2711216 RepID=UPI0013EAC50A|nr:TolC family protein [Paludisphaera rhizosphaerae]